MMELINVEIRFEQTSVQSKVKGPQYFDYQFPVIVVIITLLVHEFVPQKI